MKIKTPAFALIMLALGLQSGCTTLVEANASEPLQSIPSLDVPRYLGTWYEIAKYPNRFQKRCAGNTRAEYSQLDNGQIQVINRCEEQDGRLAEAVGLARQIGPADSSRLKVRFAPAWLSFLPVVWGNYWVIDLDPDYRLVAVSEPSRDYLWVLSRTPEVDEAAYTQLMTRLEARGFDLEKLDRTRHDGVDLHDNQDR